MTVAKAKAVTVRLDRTKPGKHVVRFDAPPSDADPATRTLYLSNRAAEALGQPQRLLVTITADEP